MARKVLKNVLILSYAKRIVMKKRKNTVENVGNVQISTPVAERKEEVKRIKQTTGEEEINLEISNIKKCNINELKKIINEKEKNDELINFEENIKFNKSSIRNPNEVEERVERNNRENSTGFREEIEEGRKEGKERREEIEEGIEKRREEIEKGRKENEERIEEESEIAEEEDKEGDLNCGIKNDNSYITNNSSIAEFPKLSIIPDSNLSQINELKETIETLNEEISKLNSENEHFKRELEIKNVLLNASKTSIYEIKKEIVNLSDFKKEIYENLLVAIENYKEACKEVEKLNLRHEQNINSINNDFNKKINQINQLNEEEKVNLAEKNEKDLFNFQKDSLKQVENAQKRVSDLIIKINELLRANSKLEGILIEKQQIIEKVTKESEEIKGDVVDLNMRIQDLEKENKINKENVDFYNKENFSLKNTKNGLVEKLRNTQPLITEMELLLESIRFTEMKEFVEILQEKIITDLETFKTEKIGLDEKLAKLNSEKNSLEEFYKHKMQTLEEKHTENVEEMKVKLEAIRNENSTLKEEKSSNKILREVAENERNDFKVELDLKSQYIKELECSINESEKSNKYYQEQLINADKTIQELKNNKISLDFAVEIDKINKKHNREIALLKLEIEKLQN
ncbi:hypothetical protein NUSPORA_00671 [Nucleospora cyclopteri]